MSQPMPSPQSSSRFGEESVDQNSATHLQVPRHQKPLPQCEPLHNIEYETLTPSRPNNALASVYAALVLGLDIPHAFPIAGPGNYPPVVAFATKSWP